MNSEIGQRRPSRFILAFKAFFRVFTNRQFADGVLALLQHRQPAPLEDQAKSEAIISKPTAPPKPTLHPLQLLTLLQREGRLVDFLMEDLTGVADAQIGAAVREVHQKCRQTLQEHIPLA